MLTLPHENIKIIKDIYVFFISEIWYTPLKYPFKFSVYKLTSVSE